MELNCKERIKLLEVLASYDQGNAITFKTLLALRAKLSFTETEVATFGLVIEDNMYKWNEQGNGATTIDITDGEQKLIADKLKELDAAGKLTMDTYLLFEKFAQTE